MGSWPHIRPDGTWDLPDRLNMAAQALDGPAGQVAIIDLTGRGRRDVTRGELAAMTDGVARRLLRRVGPGDRVGVLLSQSPWCAAAQLAVCWTNELDFRSTVPEDVGSRLPETNLKYVKLIAFCYGDSDFVMVIRISQRNVKCH